MKKNIDDNLLEEQNEIYFNSVIPKEEMTTNERKKMTTKENKEPDLNVIGDLFYNELDDLMEVAVQEACAKYPKTDWRQVKLTVLQALTNKVVVKILQHFITTAGSARRVDGDAIMKDWIEVMIAGVNQKEISSDFTKMIHTIEKEGESVH